MPTQRPGRSDDDLLALLLAGKGIERTEETREALVALVYFDDPPNVPAAAKERAGELLLAWRREARWEQRVADGLPLPILCLLEDKPIERTEANWEILVMAARFDKYPGLTEKQLARAVALVENWCQWVDPAGLLPVPRGATVLR
jgi:hypothetical protein